MDEIDLKDKPLIPDELMEKRESYECPKWLRSKLAPTRYSIQFVAWGLRDCQSGIFKSLRKPFIEVLAADKRIRSESLVSIRKNPNFARPLLVFDEAIMPTNLAGSPPIIVNLYEISRFSGNPILLNSLFFRR